MELIAVNAPNTALYQLKYFRVTGLQLFEKCAYTWAMQYLVEGIPQVSSKFARIGTAVHTICENEINFIHCNIPKNEKEVAEAWAIVPDNNNGVNEKANVTDYLRTFWEDTTSKHLATEIRLYQKFHPDAPEVSGQIDFAFEDADGCLVIMDHKTHRQFQPASYWQNRFQQLCYAYMARQHWPQYERVKFRIGYPNLGSYVEWETYPEDDVLLLQRLNTIWRNMVAYNEQNKWPQSINEECSYCPCRTVCETNIQAIQNFKASFARTVSTHSTADKLAWVKNVIKSAETLEAELTDKLEEEITAAGGVLRTTEGQWEMRSSSQRGAQFFPTWNFLFDNATRTPGLGTWMRENSELLFSVKVGGLDQLVKAFPGITVDGLVSQKFAKPKPEFKPERAAIVGSRKKKETSA